jgi:hypothetical protein
MTARRTGPPKERCVRCGSRVAGLYHGEGSRYSCGYDCPYKGACPAHWRFDCACGYAWARDWYAKDAR